MIPVREIREKAREFGVPESTIERDYAQNWLLKHLSSPIIILKGGTGIKKVYIENYRFSDDIDFTFLEKTDRDSLMDWMEESANKAREKSGINFSKEIMLKGTESGFRGTIYFNLIQRAAGTLTGIKVDITTRENERVLLPLEEKIIHHAYSDNFKHSVMVYSLEEIMAEKIRSLFMRTRPRDIYVVWFLYNKVDETRMEEILYEKCRFKNVQMKISTIEERMPDFGYAWKNSLNNQLKDLPDFHYVFNGVMNKMKNYE